MLGQGLLSQALDAKILPYFVQQYLLFYHNLLLLHLMICIIQISAKYGKLPLRNLQISKLSTFSFGNFSL